MTGFAVITVEIRLRSFAGRTGALLRNIAFRSALYGFNRLTILPGIVAVEIFPIPVLMMIDDLWKLIHLELLVLGGMGIVKGSLFKGDIFADKVDQPAFLLIKLVAKLKKIQYNVHGHWLLFESVCLAIDIIPKREVNALFILSSCKIEVFEQ